MGHYHLPDEFNSKGDSVFNFGSYTQSEMDAIYNPVKHLDVIVERQSKSNLVIDFDFSVIPRNEYLMIISPDDFWEAVRLLRAHGLRIDKFAPELVIPPEKIVDTILAEDLEIGDVFIVHKRIRIDGVDTLCYAYETEFTVTSHGWEQKTTPPSAMHLSNGEVVNLYLIRAESDNRVQRVFSTGNAGYGINIDYVVLAKKGRERVKIT